MVGRLVLAQEVRVQLLLPQLLEDYHEVAAMRKIKDKRLKTKDQRQKKKGFCLF